MSVELSVKQREAFRLVCDHGEIMRGTRIGVITTGPTALIDGQPWINWRTAEALERRNLGRVVGVGEEEEFELTVRP